MSLSRRHWLAITTGASATTFVPQAWAQTPAATAAAFDNWCDAFAADWVRESPEWATSTQFFSSAEQAALDRQLGALTPARRQQIRALAQRGLRELAAFDAKALSDSQRVGAATLRWSLQSQLDAAPFEDHNFVFNQRWGPHLRYNEFLSESHPLRVPADVDSYLARLSQVGSRLDEAIARSRSAQERGLLPPRFILERVRGQVQSFLSRAPADTDFVSALARRGARIESLAPERRQQALDEATRGVTEQIRPAYQRLLAMLDELHPRTTADAGLWRLPDGAAAYAQALAANTTTSMSADEIHRIGLQQVADIEATMDRLLKTLGKSEGTVQVRMQALRAELQPPAEPDPRPMILARYTAAIRDAERRAQSLFNLQPTAPVEVRRVPALTEASASAYYTTPAPDGSRPGVFWMPLPGPSFDMLRIRALAVHEAVPGHHFQLALQQEARELPRWRQRRIFGGGSAHSEGWALYAERLAIDNGWYEGDTHSLLGAWDAQLFRARRLVVDTGLHARRWTREQAIQYGISASEVERYVSNPGQACAYMVGMLHLLALREQAQKSLGSRFDAKAFHDQVLKTGSVPLDVLSGVVQRWAVAA